MGLICLSGSTPIGFSRWWGFLTRESRPPLLSPGVFFSWIVSMGCVGFSGIVSASFRCLFCLSRAEVPEVERQHSEAQWWGWTWCGGMFVPARYRLGARNLGCEVLCLAVIVLGLG